MPIYDSPYTDPATIQAFYETPDDEILNAEIALLTGDTQRNAIATALANAAAAGSGTDVVNPDRPRFKVDPDILVE